MKKFLVMGMMATVLGGAQALAREYPQSDAGHAATVTWRLPAGAWANEKHYAAITNALVANRVTGKIALFVTAQGFMHHPLGLAELQAQAKLGAERIAHLHALGYEAGFNLLCVAGHLDEMPYNTPKVEGAQHLVNAWNQTSPSDFCLWNDAWRTRYLTPALTALAAAKPDFIWLDDDVRTCYCPGCLERRHLALGSPATVDGFRAWMNDPKDGARNRRAMIAENRAALGEFFAFVAKVVRAVDPQIAIGDMEADSPFEGMPYPEKYAALGGGEFPTYWRSGCDGWTDETPDRFLDKLNRQAWMSAYLPRENAKFECELENWPYQHYGKSDRFTAFETLLYTAVATDGVAYNVLAHPAQDDFAVNAERIAVLEGLRPRLDAIVAAARQARPRGVWNGVGRETGARTPRLGTAWQDDFPWGWDRGFLGTDAQKAGFPVAYRAEDAEVTAPTALAVASMTEEELDRMFAGGVYLDQDAFVAALQRGREADIGFAEGKWIGDVAMEALTADPLNGRYEGLLRNARPTLPPYRRVLSIVPKAAGARTLARLVDATLDEIAPCVQGVYENARGGRVCVNGYTPWLKLGDVHSIVQLRTVMQWLSRERLAGVIEGDGRAALWVRGENSAVVVNFGHDEEQGLSLDLQGEAWAHGIVAAGDKGAAVIRGERHGERTRYRLPKLAPWSVNVFAPTRELKAGAEWQDDTVYVADCKEYDIRLGDTYAADDARYHSFGVTGVLHTAFYLKNCRNVVLDFAGATINLHGKLQPFILDGCENVTVRNVTVRYARSAYSEGEVLAVGSDQLTVRFDREKFPYRVEPDGAIVFYAPEWSGQRLTEPCFAQFFDGKTRVGRALALAYFVPNPVLDPKVPWSAWSLKFTAREEDDKVVFTSANGLNDAGRAQVGDRMVIGHEPRDLSNLLMLNCRGVNLSDYRILNGGGMGIYPFHCRDLFIDGLKLTCDERSPSVVANAADGIHAVACSGDFVIRNSVFEGTIDDALNVHGNFFKVVKAEGDRIVADTGLEMYATSGVFQPGDRIRVTRGFTMEGVAEYEILSQRVMDAKTLEFTVDRPVAAHAKGDMLENLSAQCRLRIENCRFGKGNAHLRLQTRGGILIEDCETELPVLLTGDMSYWFESSPCERMVCRRVKFVGERAGVQAVPQFLPTDKAPYYHGDLVFEDCSFDCGEGCRLEYVRSVKMRNCASSRGRLDLHLTNCGEADAPGCNISRRTEQKTSLGLN